MVMSQSTSNQKTSIFIFYVSYKTKNDIAFLNESLKSLLFRELGYEHPLSDLSKHIIVPVRSKDKKNIYTKFRGDTVVEILDYLEGIEDE